MTDCKAATKYTGALYKMYKMYFFYCSLASEKNLSRGSQHGNFIDFVAAKQREVNKKVASKQK